MTSTRYTKIQLWLLAARPKTLPAALSPVVVGSAVAYDDGLFAPLPALMCLLCAVLMQVGVNLANDYFDGKNNIDAERKAGPVRVTQSGLIPAQDVKRAMYVVFAAAVLVFCYLSLVGGLPLLLLGVLSVAAALAYSGGPYPLASHGMGELFVFVFFGLVAVGATYYIQAGRVTPQLFGAALVPGLLITAIMVVNNLRDIDTDKKAGKNSLAVILGRSRTIIGFRLLVGAAYMVPLAMLPGKDVTIAILLPLVTFPVALSLCRKVGHYSGSRLNELLAATARLSLVFSVLFSLGLVC
ncbi:1,4-dihydroxy-2-naphthoate polyprenyltransferase [Desulforhopalus singaporensis]|uniref:1,4-dihydroxy-2-naphthoate octaprenyltransferase n=1 Tax=Desulforhopalus singaporensis TaxID=91360 RepID=A0A1H0KQA2_9BACT|nr:1,4-dihydroxy-2-naphthoate polyprenyltransferase [Desulforhopalus singaporensis]SDO57950.1 1,4-dihydroxy-2-naphthoate prenyltransferase [Desulforhopalus singaporensis]